MKTWVAQLDELVEEQRYSEALLLLDTLDQAVLPDKVQMTLSLLRTDKGLLCITDAANYSSEEPRSSRPLPSWRARLCSPDLHGAEH